MKIGIIVHSQTGNTLRVGEKVKEQLSAKGHEAVILRVKGEKEGKDGKIVLLEKPDASQFDVILFGAPVWAFSVSPVMRAYLMQSNSLEGKRAGCFVTQGLSKAWMGGNRSVRQLTKLLKSKGAEVAATALIGWKCSELEKSIESAAEKMSSIV